MTIKQMNEIKDLRGLLPHVAFALRVLMLTDDRSLPAAPQPEWPAGTTLPGNPGVAFRVAYDDALLYLCWSGKGAGPLANDVQDVAVTLHETNGSR